MKAIIKDIAFYAPKNIITNEQLVQLYKEKYDIDISKSLETNGRNIRRICGKDENILTMALNSSNQVLERNNIKAEDINMIIFSTGTPEYIQPSNAIKLHNLLGCKTNSIVFDINSSCVGMVIALTQASEMMRNNKTMKYTLVVGSEQFFSLSKDNMYVPYSNFGESACTILLENIDDDSRGIIDYDYFTDSCAHNVIQLPANGMKNAILNDRKSEFENTIQWEPFDGSIAYELATDSIEGLLKKHNIPKYKVKKYFLSQFTKLGIDKVSKGLNEDIFKFKYIGDKYGYTGTTSPFISMSESLNNNEISKGDYIVFWSVGSGYTCHTSIFKL